MKRVFLAVILMAHAASAQQDYVPYMHHFSIWGTLNGDQKAEFLFGFTNGYLLARGAAVRPLMECMEYNIPYAQAVAMVDKYYKANPEKWNRGVGDEIIAALTVKGGPCPDMVPRFPYSSTQ